MHISQYSDTSLARRRSPLGPYRGISLIRNSAPLGPYGRPMTRALVVLGGGRYLISEVPLNSRPMPIPEVARGSYLTPCRS